MTDRMLAAHPIKLDFDDQLLRRRIRLNPDGADIGRAPAA